MKRILPLKWPDGAARPPKAQLELEGDERGRVTLTLVVDQKRFQGADLETDERISLAAALLKGLGLTIAMLPEGSR